MEDHRVLPFYSKLLQDLRDGTLCDVKLFGNGLQKDVPIPAHKLILMLGSPYFLNLWKLSNGQQPYKEIHLPIPHKILTVLIQYMYSGLQSVKPKLISLSRDDKTALMAGVKKLGLSEVLEFLMTDTPNQMNLQDRQETLVIYPENDESLFVLTALKHLYEKTFLPTPISTAAPVPEDDEVSNNIEILTTGDEPQPTLAVSSSSTTFQSSSSSTVSDATTSYKDDMPSITMDVDTEGQASSASSFTGVQSLSKEDLTVDTIPDVDMDSVSQSTSSSLLSSSSSSSNISNRSKRGNNVLEKIPYVDLGRRIVVQSYNKNQNSSASSSSQDDSPSSSANHHSTTSFGSESTSKCIMYYIHGKPESDKVNLVSTRHCIRSFDLQTGESKFIKSIQQQEYSSLVFHNNSIYIMVGPELDEFQKQILKGTTLILDILENGEAVWRDPNPVPLMTYPVYDSQMTVLDDVIYVIGGARNDNAVGKRNNRKFWVVNSILHLLPNDLTKGWTRFEDDDGRSLKTHPKCGASTAVVGDKIYSIGGLVSEASDKPVETSGIVECFDGVEKSVIDMKKLTIPRVGAATAVLGSKIFILGGGKAYKGSRTKVCNVFDTETNSWSKIPSMSKFRAWGAAVSFEGFIYAIGGDVDSTIEKFNPHTSQWTMYPFCLPPGGEFRSVAFDIIEG